MKPCKISAHSDKHSDNIFLWGKKVVRMSWNFVRFHEIINQRDAENFIFLSWQKKVLFLKKYQVYHVPLVALFSANRWRLDVLTLLIKGFAQNALRNPNSLEQDFLVTYSNWLKSKWENCKFLLKSVRLQQTNLISCARIQVCFYHTWSRHEPLLLDSPV